jgi:hypothetical protein
MFVCACDHHVGGGGGGSGALAWISSHVAIVAGAAAGESRVTVIEFSRDERAGLVVLIIIIVVVIVCACRRGDERDNGRSAPRDYDMATLPPGAVRVC